MLSSVKLCHWNIGGVGNLEKFTSLFYLHIPVDMKKWGGLNRNAEILGQS